MTAAASCASARLLWASCGPCIVWCPARPSVRLTSRTTWPRSHHRAAVPPALMSASSGWAPMIRTRIGCSAMKATLRPVRSGGPGRDRRITLTITSEIAPVQHRAAPENSSGTFSGFPTGTPAIARDVADARLRRPRASCGRRSRVDGEYVSIGSVWRLLIARDPPRHDGRASHPGAWSDESAGNVDPLRDCRSCSWSAASRVRPWPRSKPLLRLRRRSRRSAKRSVGSSICTASNATTATTGRRGWTSTPSARRT